MYSFANYQRGAALITSLLILLVLSIIGLAFMGSSILAERMAANEQLSIITTNAGQSGNNATMGDINRNFSTSVNTLRSVADVDLTDPTYHFSSNTKGINSCLKENGQVSAACDSSAKVDTATNLRAQTGAVYRGCSPNTLEYGYGGGSARPHYLVLTGTGWYELSGDDVPTDSSDPLSTVENTVVTRGLPCGSSE